MSIGIIYVASPNDLTVFSEENVPCVGCVLPVIISLGLALEAMSMALFRKDARARALI